MNLLAFGLLFTAAHHGGMFVAVFIAGKLNRSYLETLSC